MNRDKLVEHLHSEIASRDERIGELENDASYYAARYEDVREELEALKAANLELQIHFDIMKAELESFKVTQDRDSFISWMLSFKHPVLGWLELESFCICDDHSTYANEYIQGAWVVYNAKLLKVKAGN